MIDRILDVISVAFEVGGWVFVAAASLLISIAAITNEPRAVGAALAFASASIVMFVLHYIFFG